MNCADVLQLLGFQCAARPNNGLRVFTPFSLDDGTMLGVYVEPIAGDAVRVTDHGDTAMTLSAHGIAITPKRLKKLAAVCRPVNVTDGGALEVMTSAAQVGTAVAAVIDASLRMGHRQAEWAPKPHEERFVDLVAAELNRVAPKRVRRGPIVTGISGHQLEFPIGVAMGSGRTAFVQPIAAVDAEIDWGSVYRTTGKMSDLQQAGLPAELRLVVLEDEAAPKDAGRAATLLESCATVLLHGDRERWIGRFAA